MGFHGRMGDVTVQVSLFDNRNGLFSALLQIAGLGGYFRLGGIFEQVIENGFIVDARVRQVEFGLLRQCGTNHGSYVDQKEERC